MSEADVISKGEIAGSRSGSTIVQTERLASACLVLLAGMASGAHARSGTTPVPVPQPAVIWQGGAGYWSVLTNWGLSPGSDPFFGAVAIDAGHQSYSWVNMDVSDSLLRLAIDENDTLNLLDGHSLVIDGPGASVHSDGTIRLDAITHPTSLLLGSNSTIPMYGGGRVEMLDESLAMIASNGGSSTLENLGATIDGEGRLGANTLAIHNSGFIRASMPFRFLTVDPSIGGFTNRGDLRASNRGRLRLMDGNFVNHNGRIHAESGSRIDLEGVTVTGGVLETSASGLIRVTGTPVTLADISLIGQVELGISRLSLLGRIVNNGTIAAVSGNTLAGGGPITQFSEILIPPGSGDVKLGGTGVLDMQLAKVSSGTTQIGGRLVNQSGHTMQGSGLLGNGTAGFVNQGTLLANGEFPILIDTKPGDPFVNSGVIRAIGSGGVMFNNGTFRNDGTIEVHEGSKVFYTVSAVESNASFATLSGGIWKIFGGETPTSISLSGPGILFNNADVTLSGPGSTFQGFHSMQVNNGKFTLDQGKQFTTFGTSFSNQGTLKIAGGSRLNVSGSFSQGAGAVLRVVLGPSPIGVSSPVIVVTGVANLGGTVEIEFSPGFIPQAGQVLHLIAASSVNGSFANIIAPAGLHITYTVGDVSVDFEGHCRGDLDADGLIGLSDVESLLQQWGPCATSPEECLIDLNGDGRIDQADLMLLLALFGICP